MNRISAVLFDCDGVLVDSERCTNTLLRDNLSGHGLDLSVDQIVDLFVGGTMQGVEHMARQMGARLPDDWLGNIYEEMFDALAREVEEVPGVSDMLQRLDAGGMAYAVGSNGPHRKMEVTLARTGLITRLEGRIVSREDVAAPKPAPDVYLRAAELAGAPPAECVVIEDSATGARAAVAAGMRCFGFVRDTAPEKLAPHCDHLFDDMAELPTLVGLA